MRTYSARVQERCREAEAALLAAVQRAGTYVPGVEISRAWAAIRTADSLPDAAAKGRWRRILEPAIAAGRVIVREAGSNLYFAPSEHGALPLPRPGAGPRQYGARVEQQCRDAEAVVEHCICVLGRIPTGRDLAEHWPAVHHRALPRRLSGRWSRTLEPAIAAGRIVIRTGERHTFYAPTDRADHPLPRFVSDLERVEEALRRAVARADSAILVESVDKEIANDERLQLESGLSTGTHLSTLIQTGRARSVRPFARASRGRLYYTTLDGPHWVRREAEHVMDRRLRVIRQLWKRTGGRPCTTRVIHRYSDSQSLLPIEDEPCHAWTNALHHLEGTGDVVRVAFKNERWVRWAPAEEWAQLDEKTRQERLTDWLRPGEEIRVTNEPEMQDAPGIDRSTLYDAAFVSRNRNMRELVRLTKEHLVQQQKEARAIRVIRGRPVTAAQVVQVARDHPRLAPKGSEPIARGLSEAARLRDGMCESMLVQIGRVRNCAFYDTEHTEEGQAYMVFREALCDAEARWLRRALGDLRQAAALDASMLVPLAAPILNARLHRLRAELRERYRRLWAAVTEIELLPEESGHVREVLRELEGAEGELQRMERGREVPQDSPLAPAEGHAALDTAEAWESIAGLGGIEIEYGRLLPNRLPLVRVIQGNIGMEGPDEAAGHGRPVETCLDRIEFVRYSAARWGGPRFRSFVARGCHAMGGLRTSEPFIQTLVDPSARGSHIAAASALGLLDDERSRNALVAHIVESLRGEEPGKIAPHITVPGVHAAIYGLARLPVGGISDGLRDAEREVLELVGEEGHDEPLRGLARRVLRAWDEDWGREQLFNL